MLELFFAQGWACASSMFPCLKDETKVTINRQVSFFESRLTVFVMIAVRDEAYRSWGGLCPIEFQISIAAGSRNRNAPLSPMLFASVGCSRASDLIQTIQSIQTPKSAAFWESIGYLPKFYLHSS